MGPVFLVVQWTLLLLPFCRCMEFDLTVEVKPGTTECFWQPLKPEIAADLEYQATARDRHWSLSAAVQAAVCEVRPLDFSSFKGLTLQTAARTAADMVIDGGDLDIDFTLYAPDGRVLQMENRQQNSVVQIPADVGGDYKFCFDNTFSHLSSKSVFFEVSSEFVEEVSGDNWKLDLNELKGMIDMSLEDLNGILTRSKANLERSIQIQNILKMHEARDRNVAEANFYRINTFSAFQIFVMITVSLTQVLMIRSLFQDRMSGSGGMKQRT